MNVADSEVVASIMETVGYEMAATPEEADAVLLNTCSIRDNAEQKIVSRLAYLASLRRKRSKDLPKLIIGVIGCMGERVKEELIERHGVDLVAGPDSYLVFKQIFKTITVDNGSEFADVNGLERSILEEGEKRTHLYYCHPYSSWERGTNEVTNKMVRRKVPKGTNFDDKTDEEIEEIESWINGYPRRIHGYRSAGELFTEELEKLA